MTAAQTPTVPTTHEVETVVRQRFSSTEPVVSRLTAYRFLVQLKPPSGSHPQKVFNLIDAMLRRRFRGCAFQVEEKTF